MMISPIIANKEGPELRSQSHEGSCIVYDNGGVAKINKGDKETQYLD
jgi:hypothetical protein